MATAQRQRRLMSRWCQHGSDAGVVFCHDRFAGWFNHCHAERGACRQRSISGITVTRQALRVPFRSTRRASFQSGTPAPAGNYVVTVTVTDNCGVSTTRRSIYLSRHRLISLASSSRFTTCRPPTRSLPGNLFRSNSGSRVIREWLFLRLASRHHNLAVVAYPPPRQAQAV